MTKTFMVDPNEPVIPEGLIAPPDDKRFFLNDEIRAWCFELQDGGGCVSLLNPGKWVRVIATSAVESWRAESRKFIGIRTDADLIGWRRAVDQMNAWEDWCNTYNIPEVPDDPVYFRKLPDGTPYFWTPTGICYYAEPVNTDNPANHPAWRRIVAGMAEKWWRNEESKYSETGEWSDMAHAGEQAWLWSLWGTNKLREV